MEQMELPPGFRFHPTDEELITHYLSKKVLDGNFKAVAIGEVDLNKCEPWDLPWRAKMGEEWYLFCVRDRKYPTGLRTNRATESGYWKATGKDKDIYRGKRLVGMKKTLVFYRGRAPKGEKTDWVMHEYRLEGKPNYSVYDLPKNARNEWVICRVFNKSSAGGKKGCPVAKGGLLQQAARMDVGSSSSASYGSSDELDNEGNGNSSLLPPLMDVNIIKEKINRASEPTAAAAHVTCFSNAVLEDHKGNVEEEEEEKKYSTNPNLSLVPDYYFNKTATATSTTTTSGPFAASDVSPSSIFISKVNMNVSAAPSNPLGLNMHHHHHQQQQQQQQQHYITNPSGSLMQLLLQSNVYGVVMDQQQNGSKATDKEMLSNISQETGLTTDMNPEIEISSVNNNDDNVPNANNEVPSTSSALPLHLDDCLWGY